MRLDPQIIRQQIERILLIHPELVEDDQLRADMVEGSTEAHDFLREVEKRRREASMLIEACLVTMDDLQQRVERLNRREHAMRQLAFKVMEAADLKKCELPEATLSIRNGTPKVIITDEALLPDILCRIEREPDKTKIKELLAAGNEVRGCILSNAEPTLAIRTR